ncbi:beta-ketoacyl-ACP synthase 3 [Tabrizicola sp.]|uniref:beta-ketoacyl-ACP synthase 3 n=1 Tax=Tabrizicola sp. TaxID=2005166 RepID=UPI00273474E3|nr:beta-ketoacyl-ACP synthase 3 [Tabrizicola sp.]MDP3197674.1 beta-ketoacyl-ACP synthase 3 [Tabrizicola sp.]MDZ4065963.1 beta-ketoacyl-ACP synthase 3 [Tabrizicola sp.]
MRLVERGVVMAGFGHYLPERRVANVEIEAELDLPPGWIEARSGIRARHYATPDQAVSDLAIPAGKMALEVAGAMRDEVGLLLLATSTPDHLLPPTAPLVAHRLGLGCGAVDLAGACAGFLHALVLAAAHVRTTGQSVLVIAANLLSRRIEPTEVASRVLFGDAAGAVLLRPVADPALGLRSVVLRSDGSGYDMIRIDRGGSRLPFSATGVDGLSMRMPDGKAVFERAVDGMVRSANEALSSAGLVAADISTWAPHQANQRIIDKVRQRLCLHTANCLGTLAEHGNSSAATIPLALSIHVAANGSLDSGRMLFSAFGAGTLWGSAIWVHANKQR